MSQLDERLDHARKEFNYYAREINNNNYPPVLRHAVSAMTVVALPIFTARAFLMNDGLYRSQEAENGANSEDKKPGGPSHPAP